MTTKNTSPQCNPIENFTERTQLTRLADFLYEAGMLRKTPRTGYQFLGSGSENVAEHSFRMCIIGFTLANMAGLNPEKVVMLCLFHDFHEARIGDFNYVNRIYNSSNGQLAMEHATSGTGMEEQVMSYWQEQEDKITPEAILAKDADQLDLIANLVEEQALGNKYATKWLEAAIARLKTPHAHKLATALLETDHTDWWFKGPNADWWRNTQKG